MQRVLILLAVAALAACDRGPEPLGPERAGGPSAQLAAVSSDPTPDPLVVAQAVPGFGGYFIDASGAPTVYLTDPAQRPAAEAALAGFLSSFGWSAADLRVRQGQYSYAQLDAWYRASWTRALAVPGAVFSDIDEGNNRLRFGGVDVAAVSSITSALVSLGVPAAAVDVQLAAPVVQTASLRDKIRPPHGGLQIQFFASPVSPVVSVCTLGFNAVKDGVQSFITNSHCTNRQGGTDLKTDYYQSTRGGVLPSPDNYIGFELDDPAYALGDGTTCPLGRTCRYSDAARVQYGAGQVFTVGKVARAASQNPGTINGDDDPSVLVIDSLSPTWKITAEQAVPVLGQALNKTGRTTGWTGGTVTGTCVNINVSGSEITQLCQSYVGAFVAGGDSGSPVFGTHTDGSVFLAGILWGSSTDLVTGAVQFIFSPLGAVENELGELSTLAPDETTTTKKNKRVKTVR
ncbi:MAG TPA: hypothetical protein VGX50_18650 [Longimicrobium sp.]|jgi:hypothetical protein|nr:hypothetical protein [Longimicrobium sp.]